MWCRSSLRFKIQAREQRHRFLLWHASLFTRSDLDRNLCAYNLRTCIRLQTFWDNSNYIQVILFQIFDKLPAPLEVNSQITATCLAHTLFFKVTTNHHIFGGVQSCRIAGCRRLLKYMQHVCQSVGPLLPHGVIITFCYNIDLLISICQLYYIHNFLFLFIIFALIGRIWTTLYNPQRLFHNVKFEGSNGRIFKFGCFFAFMQINAHKLKGTGALLQLANQTSSYWHNPK